uniref:Uncharacterized protein n=1 Tax=Tanacetum cinerariifolium TaxID=118510 RepID=A0A6L2K4B7_TANCI|nr:hypothetical protein [Tanacetum cinerariifolium]
MPSDTKKQRSPPAKGLRWSLIGQSQSVELFQIECRTTAKRSTKATKRGSKACNNVRRANKNFKSLIICLTGLLLGGKPHGYILELYIFIRST